MFSNLNFFLLCLQDMPSARVHSPLLHYSSGKISLPFMALSISNHGRKNEMCIIVLLDFIFFFLEGLTVQCFTNPIMWIVGICDCQLAFFAEFIQPFKGIFKLFFKLICISCVLQLKRKLLSRIPKYPVLFWGVVSTNKTYFKICFLICWTANIKVQMKEPT